MKASRSPQDVVALIEAAFAGVARDEDCTLHQAQLADQSMRREISQEEWGAEKLRDPDSNFDQDPLEWELPNSVIFHLMQNSEDMGLAAYVLERFLQMSLQQEAAVGSGSKAAFASVDVISRRPAKS